MRSLDALFGGDEPRERPAPIAPDIEAIRLRDAFATYLRRYEFAPGDLVRRKSGIHIMSDGRGPPTGAFVVMELDPTREECRDITHPENLGMILDLYVGYYDEDGDFCFSWVDSRRFEPWDGEA